VDALIALAGFVVVVLAVSDVFQSVIVPRPISVMRPSAYVSRYGWQTVGALVARVRDPVRGENFLGLFAPALLVTFLVLWVTMLVLGFGAIFYALRADLHPAPANYWGAVYYAGTTLLTVGFGDITAATGVARALSLVSAALGLGTFAVVISFLFSLFAAFQRRESFVLTMRERTGAPPSGVHLLVRHAELRMLDALPQTFREGETFISEVMETHLAYPILIYFRSTHDLQSWIGTIGALLDASSLLLTTVDLEGVGPAKMLNQLGRHLVGDFRDYFAFEAAVHPGIERGEFAAAYAQLGAAGLPLRDLEPAWRQFSALRASYAYPLNELARYFRIPPAQWIGDRSVLPLARHAPVTAPITAMPTAADAPPESA
jgi:hypothetical protein